MPDLPHTADEESIRKRYRRLGNNVAKVIAALEKREKTPVALGAEILSDAIELLGQFFVDVNHIARRK